MMFTNCRTITRLAFVTTVFLMAVVGISAQAEVSATVPMTSFVRKALTLGTPTALNFGNNRTAGDTTTKRVAPADNTPNDKVAAALDVTGEPLQVVQFTLAPSGGAAQIRLVKTDAAGNPLANPTNAQIINVTIAPATDVTFAGVAPANATGTTGRITLPANTGTGSMKIGGTAANLVGIENGLFKGSFTVSVVYF